MSEKIQARLAFIINIAYAAVVIALVYLAMKYVLGWVLPFILAFCIVTVLHPLVRLIRKNLKIKQEIVSLIVMLLIYIIIAGLLFLIIMQIVLLVQSGLERLPAYYQDTLLPTLTGVGNSLLLFVRGLPAEWQEMFTGAQDQILSTLQTFLLDLSQKGGSAIASMTTRIPAFVITFVFTIMLSFFISLQYGKVLDFFKDQLPDKAMRVLRDLRVIVLDTVLKYLRAVLTLMMITFVELSIGLIIIRTPNALPIAAGIAVFDALPVFGTGAIMIPWCLIELIQGNFHHAFGLGIVYAIITVVRNVIEPKIIGDKLGLNPIVSLTAIYFGFKLFGVLGMIVMPMLTQIAMELHHIGTIKLFKEKIKEDMYEEEGEV